MEGDCYNWVGCPDDCDNCVVHQAAEDEFRRKGAPEINVSIPLDVAKVALVECTKGKAIDAADALAKVIREAE
jgi:hypothetical protein